jgi:hypothetical protein
MTRKVDASRLTLESEANLVPVGFWSHLLTEQRFGVTTPGRECKSYRVDLPLDIPRPLVIDSSERRLP